jgi:hypothetical protein
MGTAAEVPFRQSNFAKALGAWLVLGAFGLLGHVPIFEVLTYYPYKILIAVMGLAAMALVGWSLWRFARRPRTGWVSPLAILIALPLFFALSLPLSDAGLYLNFLRHKLVYDRLVADARAGRLDGVQNGTRYGERFHLVRSQPPFVYFDHWQVGDYYFFEIYYDEKGCPGANRGRAVHSPADGARPAMLSLGYSLHLTGHYCLRKMVV